MKAAVNTFSIFLFGLVLVFSALHAGNWLSAFEAAGLWWAGYIMALALPAFVAVFAFWTFRGGDVLERGIAVAGVVVFSLVEGLLNWAYYTGARPEAPAAPALTFVMGFWPPVAARPAPQAPLVRL